MSADTRTLIGSLIPVVVLIAVTITLGLTGFTIPADVTGALIIPVWAVSFGRALSIAHNR